MPCLFLQTSLWIGGPAPNRLADPFASALFDAPWLIWKSWLCPSSQWYLHPALLWNLTGRWGFGVVLETYDSIEVATQKMNNLPSSTGLQRWLEVILTPGCSPLQTHCDVFRELNLAADRSAQRCRCMIIGVSRELPADSPQFVIFPATVTSPFFQYHISTTTIHTNTCWICGGKHPHSLG